MLECQLPFSETMEHKSIILKKLVFKKAQDSQVMSRKATGSQKKTKKMDILMDHSINQSTKNLIKLAIWVGNGKNYNFFCINSAKILRPH